MKKMMYAISLTAGIVVLTSFAAFWIYEAGAEFCVYEPNRYIAYAEVLLLSFAALMQSWMLVQILTRE